MQRRDSSEVTRACQQVKRDAMRFADADKNGDNALTWQEFRDLQPP